MSRTVFRDYLELCKPRVVMLMLLTSLVGMCLATPHWVPWRVLVFGNLGIALVAGAAAVLNHVADQYIDQQMRRTRHRPVASGRLTARQSLVFAAVLCATGMLMLWWKRGRDPRTANHRVGADI